MIDLSRDGYSHEQIKNMLHMKHGSRKIRFRYFLLDKNENKLAEISHLVESASIEQSAFSEIKRTATFRLKDDVHKVAGVEKKIDWNSDRIQVFVEFKVPDWVEQVEETGSGVYFLSANMPIEMDTRKVYFTKKEGGWIDFSLGVFLISSPTKIEEGQSIYREVEAYDKLLIMKEDRVTYRYTIFAGVRYYDAMVQLFSDAGIIHYNIENSDKLLSTDKEYEPGTEKLAILNDLASDLNYTPFWVDEWGYFRSNQYRSPQEQAEDYIYADDEMSIVEPGSEEELDLFGLPNVFSVIVSNPDTEEVFVSTAENNNPNHPRSIPSLGRRVVRFEEKDDIADQESLDAYVERLAFQSSQIYGRVKFTTAIMPFHSYSNVLRIINKKLGINDKYAEVNWSMSLQAGASMSHEVRRVVSLT